MKTTTTKIIKLQMLGMAALVYFINAVIISMIGSLEEFKALYQNADITSVFTLGLLFALFALYGYVHAHNRTVLQVFTLAYMTPLTGSSMITMAVLYFVQKPMRESFGLWVLMTMTAFLLALSFAVCWKASEHIREMKFS